jgi:hypothetical protein
MKTFWKTAWRSRKNIYIRFFIFISIICSKWLAPSAKPTLKEPTRVSKIIKLGYK